MTPAAYKQLDTSGTVRVAASREVRDGYAWSDLSPFTQGYIEALLTEMNADTRLLGRIYRDIGFSDLAPETLTRIIADCGRRVIGEAIRWATREAANASGRAFWRLQQDGDLPAFPPLTVQLGDDGRVYFKDAA